MSWSGCVYTSIDIWAKLNEIRYLYLTIYNLYFIFKWVKFCCQVTLRTLHTLRLSLIIAELTFSNLCPQRHSETYSPGALHFTGVFGYFTLPKSSKKMFSLFGKTYPGYESLSPLFKKRKKGNKRKNSLDCFPT